MAFVNPFVIAAGVQGDRIKKTAAGSAAVKLKKIGLTKPVSGTFLI